MFKQFPILMSIILVCGACVPALQQKRHSQKIERAVSEGCPELSKFSLTGMANGPAIDGTQLSYHFYQAAKEQVHLLTVFGDFDSPSAAEAELNSLIKLSNRVVVNGWKLNANGRVVGRRVEAVLPTKSSKNVVFAVLWTSGHYFHEVSSNPNCKQAVLETEKNIRDPDPNR